MLAHEKTAGSSSSAENWTEDERAAVIRFARDPRQMPQALLVAKMMHFYRRQPNAPRLKNCSCTYHDAAVWLALYIFKK